MAALTHGVAALAAGEAESAEAHTRKAEKLLGSTPLVLLLSAQIARSKGDDNKTRLLLEQMLGHSETEYLAARSLSDAASRQQLFSKALALAQQAHAVNAKGFSAVVSLHARLGQWQEALQAIEQALRKGQLTLSEGGGITAASCACCRAAMPGATSTGSGADRGAVKRPAGFRAGCCLRRAKRCRNGIKEKAEKLQAAAWKLRRIPAAEALLPLPCKTSEKHMGSALPQSCGGLIAFAMKPLSNGIAIAQAAVHSIRWS